MKQGVKWQNKKKQGRKHANTVRKVEKDFSNGQA